MVTIKDVARDAHVAVGTVSKVVNGQHVSQESKEKVEASIKKLGYQMNYYARGLKTKYTYTIATIVPEIRNPFFAMWVYYIEQVLYNKGYKMYLCNSDGMVEKEERYFKMTAQNKVDGIICVSYYDIEDYVSENIPLVSLDRHFEKKISCVCSDNYHGGELAAEKMISTGSRNLLYIRSGSAIPGETMKRGEGFSDYCRAKNVSCEIMDLGEAYELFDEHGAAIGDVIRERLSAKRKGGKIPYDGIYTSTDWLGWVTLEQLREMGVKVPEETQLVGNDGIRWMNRGTYMMSTIVQPIKEMAEKSVELILKKIQGEETDIITMLPVTFGEGGTTR